MAYSGKYLPQNRIKYVGDDKNITYRSLWERGTFKWLDENPNVVFWSSEELAIPYVHNGKQHTYYPDLLVKFKSGKRLLIEIKPKRQTTEPQRSKRTNGSSPQKRGKANRRILREHVVWKRNQSKWNAAIEWCSKMTAQEDSASSIDFIIWTEDILRDLGIRIISPSMQRKARKTKRIARQRK